MAGAPGTHDEPDPTPAPPPYPAPPPPRTHAALYAALAQVDGILELFRFIDQGHASTRDYSEDFQKITGHPPMTIEQWINASLASFQVAPDAVPDAKQDGATIAVIGASGSVGRATLRRLVRGGPARRRLARASR